MSKYSKLVWDVNRLAWGNLFAYFNVERLRRKEPSHWCEELSHLIGGEPLTHACTSSLMHGGYTYT